MIKSLPNEERPRERLMRLGVEALTDRELLAIVLRSGTPRLSAIELASELLSAHGGTLLGLSELEVPELCLHNGIGPAKAVEIRAAFGLAKRIAEGRGMGRPLLNSPELICCMMAEKFRGISQEECHVLLLDTKMRLIRDELVTSGLLDRSLVHPREVFRSAIQAACKSVIVCHNHPSGDPTPSDEDFQLTTRLVESGVIIGIEVLDHIVVANPDVRRKKAYYSFRENGQM